MTNIEKIFEKLNNTPEPSGKEKKTAQIITDFLKNTNPTFIKTNFCGNGILAEYIGENSGKVLTLRAEMDAIKVNNNKYAHLCGHSAHMAILLSVAEEISKCKIKSGKLQLLFQPAEETGQGGKLLYNLLKKNEIQSDYIYALHNLPGYTENSIIIKKGTFSASSCGLKLIVKGKPYHASCTNQKHNPTNILPNLLKYIDSKKNKNGFISICGITTSKTGFGTTPSNLNITLTVRNYSEKKLLTEINKFSNFCFKLCKNKNLEFNISKHEFFPETINDEFLCDILSEITLENNYPLIIVEKPFTWSEDFGHYAKVTKACLFGFGIGKNIAGLHEKDYFFPKKLLPHAKKIWLKLIEKILEIN